MNTAIEDYPRHVFFGNNKRCACHGMTEEEIIAKAKEDERKATEEIARMMHL